MDSFKKSGEWAVSAAQRGLVVSIGVGDPVLPASPDDSLPFVGKSSHGGVVPGTPGSLLVVESRRPAGVQDAFLGVFMEALAVEKRALIATMDVALAPALLGHGGDPAVPLEARTGGKAFALRPQGGE